MKLFRSLFTIYSVFIGVQGGLMPLTALAQTNPSASSVVAQRPLIPPPPPQHSARLDFSLLGNSLLNLIRGAIYHTESRITLQAACDNYDIGLNYRVNSITQYPDRFRTEITFLQDDGSPGFSVLLVNNGEKVWYYRSDRNRYTVRETSNFLENASHLYILLGFLNFFYLRTPAPLKAQVDQGMRPIDTIVSAFLSGSPEDQVISDVTLGYKKIHRLYEFQNPANLTARFFVDPYQQRISQLDFTVYSEEQQLNLKEEVAFRVEHPTFAASHFHFVPPEGAREVNALNIEPFRELENCFQPFAE